MRSTVVGTVTERRVRVRHDCYFYSRDAARVPGGETATLTGFTAPTPQPRNPDVWMPDVDFSSCPVWVRKSGNYTNDGRGCLVTPRHVVMAEHNTTGNGDEFGFLSMAGAFYSRSQVGAAQIIQPDMSVVLLNADLPSDIVPAKLLPTSPSPYFSADDFAKGIRSVMIGKFNDLIPRRWVGYSGDFVMTLSEWAIDGGDPDIFQFSRMPSPFVELQGGDSGSANYLIINGEAVLLGTNFGDGLTSPHHQRTAFDAAMSALGTFGHSVSVVDLSGFMA